MRLRAAFLALLALPLAGCFAHAPDDRLAQPTDQPAIPVPPTPDVATPPPPDYSDPGYVTNATWHVGDGWDYAAKSGRYHTVRVVASAVRDNHTWFQTRETDVYPGSPPNDEYARWVDATTWTVANGTDSRGFVTRYAPPAPERFLRNGTYAYNVTLAAGPLSILANAYYQGRPPIALPWGQTVYPARIAHYVTATHADRSHDYTIALHWFAGEYGNDVRYQLTQDADVYDLVAVVYGGVAHNHLLPT
ncbi:MAG: hypothetical protein QOE90_1332 [Thermoplasmata archaeon]|nr:hypothetical protein [Thermoplasmata archaeon]